MSQMRPAAGGESCKQDSIFEIEFGCQKAAYSFLVGKLYKGWTLLFQMYALIRKDIDETEEIFYYEVSYN